MPLSFLDQISQQYQKGLPFVAYRKPNEAEVRVIFQRDRELHYVTNFTECGFVFAPFDGENPAVLIKNDEAFVAVLEPSPSFSNRPVISLQNQDLNKDSYLELINKAVHNIDSGEIKKVVLSRSIDLETTKTPFVLFNELLHQNLKTFCYLWFHPKIGLWSGATPEILLETRNGQFKTMSLAGTQLYKGENVPIWEEKELKEQAMVTQFIRESLQDKVSSLLVSEAESTRAGNLWHIRTSVSGNMKASGLKEIITALHPTPAVCGVPKIRAKEFIIKNENYDRQYYTGYLGELNFKEEISRPTSRKNQENRAYRTIKKKTSLYVNLRCMQLSGNIVRVYVGGGITSGSVPEKEWQETKDKSLTMLNIVLK